MTALVPVLIILGAMAIAYLIIRGYRFSRRDRRSPLVKQLLRPPGESLRSQIEVLSFDVIFCMMMLLVVPLLLYSMYMAQVAAGHKPSPLQVILALVFVVPLAVKLWKLLHYRNKLRLGLDCELAVGQELNQLMLEGYRIFHDFPAEQFNIDHIVVGTKGIFAVETKGRAKPDKNRGTEDATVVYNGVTLQFPGWSEKKLSSSPSGRRYGFQNGSAVP